MYKNAKSGEKERQRYVKKRSLWDNEKGMQRGMQYEREKDRTPKMQGLRISSRMYAVAFLFSIYKWLIRKTISKLFVHILGNWSPAPDRLYSWAIYLPLFYCFSCISLSLHLTHSLSPMSLFFSLSTLLSLSLLVSLSYGFLSLFSMYLLLFSSPRQL